MALEQEKPEASLPVSGGSLAGEPSFVPDDRNDPTHPLRRGRTRYETGFPALTDRMPEPFEVVDVKDKVNLRSASSMAGKE